MRVLVIITTEWDVCSCQDITVAQQSGKSKVEK